MTAILVVTRAGEWMAMRYDCLMNTGFPLCDENNLETVDGGTTL